MPPEALSVKDLLERMRGATEAEGECVSLADVLDALGSRTYGPFLVVLGLLIVSPIGDIPGASALLAAVVALVAAQLLLRRKRPWLPDWMLRRSVRSRLLERSLRWLEKPAGFIDRHMRPRLRALTGRFGRYVIAACCLCAALLLIPLEFVPGASTIVGTALTAFGLALMTHDGLAALVAFAFTLGAGALLIAL